MDCDLHIHSKHSDGSEDIAQIISIAKRKRLQYIAISDHDTMAGVEEARILGEEAGMCVLPAVETTARDEKRGRAVHILAYCSKNPEILKRFLDKTLENRIKQKVEMIKKVQERYPLLQLDDVLKLAKESQAIYEPHIIQALCNLGYGNAPMGELLDKLISSKGSCYVPSCYPNVKSVLEVMRAAKATIVIAHPEQFDSMDLVLELAESDCIDGVEISHPRNGAVCQQKLREVAKYYNLFTTGGSDFHGAYAKKPHPIGSYGCSRDIAESILIH